MIELIFQTLVTHIDCHCRFWLHTCRFRCHPRCLRRCCRMRTSCGTPLAPVTPRGCISQNCQTVCLSICLTFFPKNVDINLCVHSLAYTQHTPYVSIFFMLYAFSIYCIFVVVRGDPSLATMEDTVNERENGNS